MCGHSQHPAKSRASSAGVVVFGEGVLVMSRKGRAEKMFCHSVVVSSVYFGVVCWSCSIGAGDISRLSKLIRKGEKDFLKHEIN